MSLNFDAARLAFETFINAELTGAPTTYENAPDSADVRAAKDAHTDWVRVTVKQGAGFAVDVGPNRTHRYPGILMVSLFGQLDKGTKTLRDRATAIANAVLGESFTGIHVRTPELTLMGKENDWWLANLTIPFELDQIT